MLAALAVEGFLLLVGFPAAKGTPQIRAVPVAGIGDEEDAAVPAGGPARPEVRPV
jgi:hypothetical protein